MTGSTGSLWQAGLTPADLVRRPGLDGDTDVDVCVVGGGYTGLWSAYYLLANDPGLRVLVVEAEHVGFGASGRNGGWCSALFPLGVGALARRHGRDAALDLLAAMRETVDEVGAVAAAEGVDCGFRKGGTLSVARSAAQLARARAEVAEASSYGLAAPVLLSAQETRERAGVRGAVGATYSPDCARLHPARLVHGLARAVEARGARVVEFTRATRIAGGPGRAVVDTTRGRVTARHVLRATEAWTARLPGLRRVVAPVYSLVVATEPLPRTFWDTAGLAQGETLGEQRHVIIYAQRTEDDRLVLGGRGAPYHLGSSIAPKHDLEPTVFAALKREARDLFEGLDGARFTHRWGGPLGIARDWHPSVGLDPVTGVGWAGGYVGDGVAAANLAGRTLADLVTGRRTPVTRLAWVGHRSRRWEPEPLRWVGVNAGLRLAELADAEERRTGRPARLGRALSALTGH